MELDMHVHAASLSKTQVANNQAGSAFIPRSEMKPLQVTHIGPEDVKRFNEKLPYMV